MSALSARSALMAKSPGRETRWPGVEETRCQPPPRIERALALRQIRSPHTRLCTLARRRLHRLAHQLLCTFPLTFAAPLARLIRRLSGIRSRTRSGIRSHLDSDLASDLAAPAGECLCRRLARPDLASAAGTLWSTQHTHKAIQAAWVHQGAPRYAADRQRRVPQLHRHRLCQDMRPYPRPL